MGSGWILGRLAWEVRIGFDCLRTGTGAGCCECGDEPSGSCATELVSYILLTGMKCRIKPVTTLSAFNEPMLSQTYFLFGLKLIHHDFTLVSYVTFLCFDTTYLRKIMSKQD
jgi:hypothetical protein